MEAEAVYRRLAPAVLGYLRSQGAPDPEDVLSEVFLQVARSLPRFRGDDDHLRAWVFTIARNRLIDERRRRAARPAIADRELPDGPAPADEQAVDPDLLAALAQLTDDQREVVALRFVADISLEEVASITGRTPGAVKSMQHRALAQLARILDGAAPAFEDDG
jgi:RNA polymerase sigma-70 factor (ECF subfamily)